jgi:ATP-binding cassette subfamily F protein 3
MKSIRKRKAMARAQTQPLRNKLKALETQLADVEVSQRQIDMALSEPELYGGDNQERLKALRAQQSDNRARQASLEEDWLTAAAELEAVTESR